MHGEMPATVPARASSRALNSRRICAPLRNDLRGVVAVEEGVRITPLARHFGTKCFGTIVAGLVTTILGSLKEELASI
jgi:hypothetical protein